MTNMRKPERKFLKTIRGRRLNGELVEIDEYLMSVPDPTSTGTIWSAPPIKYPVHKLRSGESVDVFDDGTAMINGTGESLRLIR